MTLAVVVEERTLGGDGWLGWRSVKKSKAAGRDTREEPAATTVETG